MDVSARNKLPGQVKEVKLGQVMAEITLKIGENEVVAVVTRTSAERLGLKVGDKAYALVKATEIMVGKD
ncbi:MAG: TOBE domain-containing protein [Deltaproteobacteria bacterium]|nr:TOBE domain-containing protein [Deltaproteobacteria bacterium]